MHFDPETLLDTLMQTEGALCVGLIESLSGMVLECAGDGVDIDLAAPGCAELLQAAMRAMSAQREDDPIEDIVITLPRQYHLLRPLPRPQGLLLYGVFDRQRTNLAMARRAAQQAQQRACP
jgi:hypothetical protein